MNVVPIPSRPSSALAESVVMTESSDPASNGKSAHDDTAKLARLFASAAAAAGDRVITIPPGNYYLSGKYPITLPSNTTIFAYGARFHLPKTLSVGVHFDLFCGVDLIDFSWSGGHFFGHCFDHRRAENTWEPNVCTRAIVITTSKRGRTANLAFRDIKSNRVAGAVVTVQGALTANSESEVEAYAENVTLDNCTLLESGKFMWDYGMLWQIAVWPGDYSDEDQKLVGRYFRNDLVHSGVSMEDGDDRVYFDNSRMTVTVSKAGTPHHAVCFYNDSLPRNIVRGRQYFVVESTPEFIRVSECFQGSPVRFEGAAGPQTRLIHDLFQAYMALYVPTGHGLGKGSFDLVGCRNVRVTNSMFSSLGDTMHIQRSRDIIFAQNHIIGSRMGAFFLAEYCKNSTITGNVVDGTNGSRIISVEKSNEDVTIVGNAFSNGGRGSWINQPKNLILKGNIFTNNTTKCHPDPWLGRRTYRTGDWESYPEIYFSVYEPGAQYGPVLLSGNVFNIGPEAMAAVQFECGAQDVIVEGNVFRGGSGNIIIDEPNPGVTIRANTGQSVIRKAPTSRFVND